MNYLDNINFAVTVTDKDSKIIYMNEKSAKTFEKYGGSKLIGANLLDCHNEVSKGVIAALLQNKETNVYTIDKNGIKKLIYQTPWYEEGKQMGLVELSLEIPEDMPHYSR